MDFDAILDAAPDEKLTLDGVPLEAGSIVAALEGVTIWVRHTGGRNYRSYLIAARRAVLDCQDTLGEDQVPTQEQWEPYLRALVAGELIARWAGVEEHEGVPMDYTPMAGEQVLAKYPALLYAVFALAEDSGRFRLDADTKSAG